MHVWVSVGGGRAVGALGWWKEQRSVYVPTVHWSDGGRTLKVGVFTYLGSLISLHVVS